MQSQIQLLPDEEILFENERAVLTNRRLIGNFGSSSAGGFDDADLREIGPPNKFNGGYQSKKDIALMLLVVGVAVVAVSMLLRSVFGIDGSPEALTFQRLEALTFLIGALAFVVGIYLLLNSLFRHSPNTTIIFPVLEGEDIIASFPEWDNADAEELSRRFARAKRGIGR